MPINLTITEENEPPISVTITEGIGVTTGGGSTTVIDNLTSTSSTSALSANQGRVLDEGKAAIDHNHAGVYDPAGSAATAQAAAIATAAADATSKANAAQAAAISTSSTAISDAVTALIGGAPGALDTLNELAAALADDASFSATITSAIAGKATSAQGALADSAVQPSSGSLTIWRGTEAAYAALGSYDANTLYVQTA